MSDDRVYLVVARIGPCRVCGKEDDLRFGVCFDCCGHVDGEKVGDRMHRLWDRRNPDNEWFVRE